jgi:PhnB protein
MTKVTPYLCCKDAAAALDFYKAAFGAEETMRMVDESGKVGHAEMKIDDAVFMLSDEWPEGGVFGPETLGGTPLSLHLQVTNVDEFFAQALTAGATEERGVQDQAYGERSGVLKDPFGHRWFIGTPIEGFGMDDLEEKMGAEGYTVSSQT